MNPKGYASNVIELEAWFSLGTELIAYKTLEMLIGS